jgi:methanogenic corrinoid protein MtbC1/DNA-binding transcriptional MerR regulator
MIPEEPAADLRLDQLSKLTGLSPLLIRAWERRYGFPAAVRTQGGHRRFTRAQAEVLLRAATLVRSGFRAADAIARARAVDASPAGLDGEGTDAVLKLLLADDPARALDHLRGSWLAIGLEATLEGRVLPAMRVIGDEWAAGRLSVAQEHQAAGVVMSWLGAIRAEMPRADRLPIRYLIATPEGEEHGIAVWALELLLQRREVGALALGVSVPAPDLVEEVRRLHPKGVVLSLTRPGFRRWVASFVEALRAARLSRVVVFAGGRGAVPSLPNPVITLPGTLAESADFLAR